MKFCFPSYITESLESRSLLSAKSITFSRMHFGPDALKEAVSPSVPSQKKLTLIFMLGSLAEILFTHKMTGLLEIMPVKLQIQCITFLKC